ncbi:hypothetical protein PspLS_08669 [Pyricularia sp. CBS 133598]|nr:hypothetical protein PspLS_08669 [Pyricularia sp. CBS 133598]
MHSLFIFGLATFAGMTVSAEKEGFNFDKLVRKGLQPPVGKMAPQLVARTNPVVPLSVTTPGLVHPSTPKINTAEPRPNPLQPPPAPNTGSDNGPPPSANSPGRSAGPRLINSVGVEFFAVVVGVTAYLA